MTKRITIGLESFEVDDAVADAFTNLQRRLDAANDDNVELREQCAAASQRQDAARADFAQTVQQRVALERSAARVLGENERFDGLSDREIRERAIAKVDPKKDLKRRSDDYVSATFDNLIVDGVNKVNVGLMKTQAVFTATESSRADALRRRDDGDDDGDDDDDDDDPLTRAVTRHRNAGHPVKEG